MVLGLPDIIAAIALISLIAYALLGGADFGGGVWDLLASGPRAQAQRETIAHAIGPIWEANHVWLILVVVILFTAFPPAFAAIMTALSIPLHVLLVGIVLRGVSFVLRAYAADDDRAQRRWGWVFAVSSTITPVLLGIVIGTISTSAIRLENGIVVSSFFSWLQPFAFAVGFFALAQFAFLAAVYLTLDTTDPDLREDFRRRALGAAAAVGVMAATVLVLAGAAAPTIRDGLLHRWWSLPLHVLTGAMAIGAIVALWQRWYPLARLLAAGQVALILLGWGLAMYPYLIAGQLTIQQAAAPAITLRLLLIGLAAGAVVLLPSLAYLFRTFKGGLLFGPLQTSESSDEHR